MHNLQCDAMDAASIARVSVLAVVAIAVRPSHGHSSYRLPKAGLLTSKLKLQGWLR